MKDIQDNLDEISADSKKEDFNKPFNKLGRFLKKLGDENSDIHKIIKGTEKGVEIAQKEPGHKGCALTGKTGEWHA
jgi:internalin A